MGIQLNVITATLPHIVIAHWDACVVPTATHELEKRLRFEENRKLRDRSFVQINSGEKGAAVYSQNLQHDCSLSAKSLLGRFIAFRARFIFCAIHWTRLHFFDRECWTHLVTDQVVLEDSMQLEIKPTVLNPLGSIWHDEVFNPPLIRARLN